MSGRALVILSAALLLSLLTACSGPGGATPRRMEWIEVAPDRQAFICRPSGEPFIPWGFNYDHDENGRLLEEYWVSEWPKVEQDFREMKALGANTVRVHLQFGRFMTAPDVADVQALAQLDRLVSLAERLGLYLDLTGLACYLKEDVPPWYDALPERQRWDAQCAFWSAISERCSRSPAIFCYDLMNEPLVPGGRRDPGQWLAPPFAGKYHYVQFITLDQADRSRPDIAREWLHELTAAIRKHDRRHLVTVGLVDWNLNRPGLTSGFVPEHIAQKLDFISVHIYPETGKLEEAIATLEGFRVGKPVVVEEMFPLKCSAADLRVFIQRSRPIAAGWIGFYWGKSIEEYRESGTIAEAITAAWLELFREGPPELRQ